MIESSSNAKIKNILKLMKTARYRRQKGLFVVEGFKMTKEAICRGDVQEIYVSKDALPEWEKSGLAKETDEKCKVYTVSASVFKEMADTVTPQGILSVVRMPVYDREFMISRKDASLLLLEDIQDPGNLGTMIRTAEGAGMRGVVMSKGCVDVFNPKVVRSTMGALFRVPYYICESMTEEVKRLKADGFTTYAAHLDGTCDFTEEAYKGKTGVIIGNEARGLLQETAKEADRLVKIPMEGELESLNAAVSAALFMYEIHRNRR